MASKLFWGVDSLLPANGTQFVPGGKTLYELVQGDERAPDFWGRYIVGAKGQALTKDEAKFLLDRKCRILPIYNGASPASVKEGRQTGIQHATAAIKAASALGIPKLTFIYCNLEWDWSPTKDWILGWWETMFTSVYGGIGGFYCNPAPFNNKFLAPYRAAIDESAKARKPWSKSNPCVLFSSAPTKGCGTNRTKLSWEAFEPSFHTGSTVLWQYAINCHTVGTHGLYDKDLANERGFDTLWKPATP